MLPVNSKGLLQKYAHTLDRMGFVSRTPGSLQGSGRRPGTAAGYSVDFADYRKYNYGDDVRYIDWSIYARLKKLFLRQFRAESELTIHILLDTSNSMNYGHPSKLLFARKLAAACGYVGLGKQDRVGLTTFSDRLHSFLPPQRGNQQLVHILKMLDQSVPGGVSEFEPAFRSYVGRASTRGLAVILSDYFSPSGYQNAFRCLSFAGFEVVVIRILAVEELSPELEDGTELKDLEHGEMHGPIVSDGALSRYRRRMSEYSRGLATFCIGEGYPFVEVTSSISFEDLTLRLMRAGIWRAT
jgi:uncharacterized protein (DUF58 family)